MADDMNTAFTADADDWSDITADTLSLDVGQAELEITCNFKGAGNILKPKKNPKIKVLDCTDEELME